MRPCRTGTRSGSRVASCCWSSATGSGRSAAGAQPLWLDRGVRSRASSPSTSRWATLGCGILHLVVICLHLPWIHPFRVTCREPRGRYGHRSLRRDGAAMTNAERERVEGFGRLEDGLRQAGAWYLWGPYVSERQWGTVREDYSADGDAWAYVPHDHARSRAYRWGEEGMAGFSDVEQRLCLGLALWNGRDPILKERMFGLTGAQANHGEDVKENWWNLDAVPSHAWNRWRYHYPQVAFPYDDLLAGNRQRGKLDPEYELLDTGAFDEDRYWIVEVDYAKADPTDLLMVVRVTNAGPEAATLHVLPTAWFRNTWSWEVNASRPRLRGRADGAVAVDHPFLGDLELLAGPGGDGVAPPALFCENETNSQRLYGVPGSTPYPKDGINDHVVHGAATVNPDRHGTKAAL